MASVFLLQIGILHFSFKLSQLSEIVLQSKNLHRRKTDFSERGLSLNVIRFIILFFYFFYNLKTILSFPKTEMLNFYPPCISATLRQFSYKIFLVIFILFFIHLVLR